MKIGILFARYFLILTSIALLGRGAYIFLATWGVVRSSEFGMLITIANMMALLFIWLASFAFYLMCCYQDKLK